MNEKWKNLGKRVWGVLVEDFWQLSAYLVIQKLTPWRPLFLYMGSHCIQEWDYCLTFIGDEKVLHRASEGERKIDAPWSSVGKAEEIVQGLLKNCKCKCTAKLQKRFHSYHTSVIPSQSNSSEMAALLLASVPCNAKKCPRKNCRWLFPWKGRNIYASFHSGNSME